MDNTLISCFRLCSELLKNITPYDRNKINNGKTFFIQEGLNDKYEMPNLIVQETTVDLKHCVPNVILISAAGATGKTELVKYLSASKTMPIVNLTEHPAVGHDSLTGLLVRELGPVEFGNFALGINNGDKGILIDALDEANLKVNNNGFFSFLDDLANWSKSSASVVVFGRTEVMGLAYEFFKEKDIKVASLQIAPFTKEQAKKFINKQVGNYDSCSTYKKLRDYIIDSVEGFFDKDGDVTKRQKDLFLGYAPVLLAVSKLMIKHSNYQKLLNEMQNSKKTKVNLILSIIDYILDREKEDKIDKILLPELLKGRDGSFKFLANSNCYNQTEQCYRLFCRIIGTKEDSSPTDDIAFNDTYNKKIVDTGWSGEHPFLVDGNKMQNIVFESYVLLKLLMCPEYEMMVLNYLKHSHQNGYMFFFLFEAMAGQKENSINPFLIPYLYDSLKSIDRKDFSSSLCIESISEGNTVFTANVVFTVGSDKQNSDNEIIYQTVFDKQNPFEPRKIFSDVSFNVPVTVCFNSSKTQLTAPIDISCDKILVCCDSLAFTCVNKADDWATLYCNDIEIDYQAAALFDLKILNFNEGHFAFVAPVNLPHPFIRYQKQIDKKLSLNGELLDKYKKLRSMMSMFRKHSRSQMGKMKEKIDNRIGTTFIGKSIIDSLLEKGVMEVQDHLYVIDDTKFSKYLGVTYASLRTFDFNEKTKIFLENTGVSSKYSN